MRSDRVAWERFTIMVRSGVPHAVAIASELIRHELLSPWSNVDRSQEIDLKFYGVIHRAYQLGVLPKLLDLFESLKKGSQWSVVRDNLEVQRWIVQLCSEGKPIPSLEIDHQLLELLQANKKDGKSVP